jgi:type II restriction/modification system DNA methylase subunit YeeA
VEEKDFRDQVEIIGWLYQYYISEKKDQVFAGLKKNKKITKENIPAATQLFTPKWIVKYMTENSLGRLWQESHPDEDLKAKWDYYLEPADQEPEVQEKLDQLKDPNLSPEEITVLDPAMGSGHILVYAFDLLYDIYESRGYMTKEIPRLILEKNLYGLDIDDRAAQLSTFALIMKARSKNRRFLNQIKKDPVKLNIFSIQESKNINENAVRFIIEKGHELGYEIKTDIRADVRNLLALFENAKEYGSLLEVNGIDLESIERIVETILADDDLNIIDRANQVVVERDILPLVQQAKLLTRKYDAVITNPPYMGGKGLSPNLKEFFKANYPDVKSDAFSVFVYRNFKLAKQNGHLGFMTPFVWMFISSYEKLRKTIINAKAITSLIQLEYSGFDGATVPICTYTLRNTMTAEKGEYIKLSDFRGAENQPIKTRQAILNPDVDYRYTTSSQNFAKIPGSPIAYWVSDIVGDIYSKNNLLTKYGKACKGIDTGDNSVFLKLWHEVSLLDFGYEFSSYREAEASCYKYYPYNKGGRYRKWYGNNDYVIHWDGGEKIRSFSKSNLRNKNFYMQEGLTWGTVTSSEFSIRSFGYGYFFDNGGSCVFSTKKKYLLAFLNSKITRLFLKTSPTLNFQPGNIANLPVIFSEENNALVESISNECIRLSKHDWDNFETSWDFKLHPLLDVLRLGDATTGQPIGTLEGAFRHWALLSQQRFDQLKTNEEELNRIFIEIYGLEDELTPEVEDKDVTVRLADELRDIRSFISYAVGCMFGRYSLDEEGLVFAGGSFDPSRYAKFVPCASNLLLITEEDYFEDDIVHRFVDFVQVAFGSATLEENLRYIARVLNPKAKGSARDTIRAYFVKDFYKDHVKTYKKRPIYWMIDSGKQKGVKALFYLHRYEPSTIATFRTEYLHPLQRAYENDIELTLHGDSAADKKRVDVLRKKLLEVTDFDKVVAHIAHRQVELDLDDGVEVNYDKLQMSEVEENGKMRSTMLKLLAKRK